MSTRSPAASPRRLAWPGSRTVSIRASSTKWLPRPTVPEALEVTGGNVAPSTHGPGRVVGIPVGVQRAVEVGEPGGELLGYGALELDGEHGDAAADVGAHQERVQHGRRHGGADRGALAGVQVRHGGDVDHAVEGGHLVALRDGVGLDPARGGGEHGDGGRRGLLRGVLLRTKTLSSLKGVWTDGTTARFGAVGLGVLGAVRQNVMGIPWLNPPEPAIGFPPSSGLRRSAGATARGCRWPVRAPGPGD